MGDGGGDKDGDGGWSITHVDHVATKADDGFADDVAPVKKAPAPAPAADDDDDYGDDITVKTGVKDVDPSVLASAPKTVKCRRYDITVTYDQYHACPRAWLIGYSEDNRPLTKDEVCQDIYSDYADKTATVETHPFLGTPTVSIHPCKHTETMVALMARMEDKVREAAEESGEMSAEQAAATAIVFPPFLAMFLFLKFISSVVPTVQYDITAGIDF
jgi:ubiquitin-like-conjugating enzyme ATG3